MSIKAKLNIYKGIDLGNFLETLQVNLMWGNNFCGVRGNCAMLRFCPEIFFFFFASVFMFLLSCIYNQCIMGEVSIKWMTSNSN